MAEKYLHQEEFEREGQIVKKSILDRTFESLVANETDRESLVAKLVALNKMKQRLVSKMSERAASELNHYISITQDRIDTITAKEEEIKRDWDGLEKRILFENDMHELELIKRLLLEIETRTIDDSEKKFISDMLDQIERRQDDLENLG